MKRPKILIAMHYMELGGAEAALLGLLQSVDPDRAAVDVFIYAHRGELMHFLKSTKEKGKGKNEKFHLLPEVEEYAMLEEPIALLVKKGYWRLALARLWGRWEYKRYQKNNVDGLDNYSHTTFQQYHTVKCLPMINPEVEYDLAISFLTPHYIVLDKVRAKKKLGWIHTDYTNVFINREMELRMWERLDVISSISPDVSEKFAEVFPTLKDKIIDIENILSPRFIRMRSEEPCPVFENDPSLKLLTIGRYSKAKKMEDIPFLCREIVRKLGELGVRSEELGVRTGGELLTVNCSLLTVPRTVKWYIIGYGSEEIEQQVKDAIKEEGMEEHVILLGKQSNPYPFIRTCDIYVQPSRYEGKSITVREAQILCKPVIVTHYPTATSQIRPTLTLPHREGTLVGKDGVIVPLEREACAEAMIEVVRDETLLKSLTEYLAEHDYGNEEEIEKIYNLADIGKK